MGTGAKEITGAFLASLSMGGLMVGTPGFGKRSVSGRGPLNSAGAIIRTLCMPLRSSPPQRGVMAATAVLATEPRDCLSGVELMVDLRDGVSSQKLAVQAVLCPRLANELECDSAVQVLTALAVP
mmetsp:Transcript_59138/g.132528  ORF Transcript_59138/g.132528 Transcript_59138/m.132528 type:complete len:125 (+) Transcript_59138:205-579(+)|eukprot:2626757-Amphidinium_carterae.2